MAVVRGTSRKPARGGGLPPNDQLRAILAGRQKRRKLKIRYPNPDFQSEARRRETSPIVWHSGRTVRSLTSLCVPSKPTRSVRPSTRALGRVAIPTLILKPSSGKSGVPTQGSSFDRSKASRPRLFPQSCPSLSRIGMGEVVTLVEERDSVGLGAGIRETVPKIELRGMVDQAAIGLCRFEGLATDIR